MRLRLLPFLLTLSALLAGGLARAADVMPTDIPWEAAAQVQMKARLAAIAPAARSPTETRQLVLLAVAAAGEAPQESARIAEAEAVLAPALARFPDDAELAALDGSLSCMKAAAPDLPGLAAMAAARQGFRKLDAAVASDPERLGARLQRALTFLRAPGFLGKGPAAQADLEYLLQRVPSASEYAGLRALLLYHLGEAQANNGAPQEAAATWGRAAALEAPGWSARAAARLR